MSSTWISCGDAAGSGWEAFSAIATALGALGTFVAVAAALGIPYFDRQRKEIESRLSAAEKRTDAATIMLPMVEDAAGKFAIMSLTLMTVADTHFVRPQSVAELEVQSFHDMKDMLQFADYLPPNARRLLAQAIGWGARWNDLVKKFPHAETGGTEVQQFMALRRFDNLVPSISAVLEDLEKWTRAVGTGPSIAKPAQVDS